MLPTNTVIFFTFTIQFFGTFVPTGSNTVSCYQCNSYVDSECKDNPGNYKKPCPSGTKGCRKLDQFYMFGDKEETRVLRQCSKTQPSDEIGCSPRFGTNGNDVKIEYCECKGDNCNTGSPRVQLWPLEILLIFSGILGVTLNLGFWVEN